MVCIPILNRTFDGFISRIKSASYGNGMVVMAEFVYSENTGADIFMHLAVEGCDKHIIARVSADKSYEEKRLAIYFGWKNIRLFDSDGVLINF